MVKAKSVAGADTKLGSGRRVTAKSRPPKSKRLQSLHLSADKGARRRSRTGNGTSGQRRYNDRRGLGGFSVTFQLPPLPRPIKQDLSQVSRTLKKRPLLLVPIVAVIIIIGFVMIPGSSQPTVVKTAPGVAKTKADFKILTPPAVQASAPRYDSKRDLVSYTTTFSGVRLTVSQQALPATFVKDPAALLKTADSIRAKQRIDTVKGPVFVATNDQAGDQLAVYASPQLLVLIHTDRKLDDASWRSFIELLRSKP